MGTISKRTRDDGSVGYTAQIVKKRGGKRVFSEAKTFDRRGAAEAWMRRREGELAQPGGLEAARNVANDMTIGELIDHYTTKTKKTLGRTKTQVLNTTKSFEIANVRCSEAGSDDIVTFAEALRNAGRSPATVANYLSHLAPIFKIARPAWKIPLDAQVMEDGRTAAHNLGLVGKSIERERRPTLDELDKLMAYFVARVRGRVNSYPMHKLIAYAIFSCRRQDEICRITFADMDAKHMTQMVRDMKDPEAKIGNDVLCDLTPEALAIAQSMPASDDGRIFPFDPKTVSAYFTRACQFLEIEDLHFHDLRHEGVSRLFEMDNSIPRVAGHSGHRSWATLKRYAQIRGRGDKYEGWKWLPIVTAKGWAPLVIESGARAG